MRTAVLLAFLAFAHSASAEIVVAKAAILRVQDKMTGIVSDYDLPTGGSQTLGRLTVTLDECRYPSDLSMAEAYAHLTIMDSQGADPLFKGWMVASSPALSALDHPRYDVWVLRCDVPQTVEGEGSGG
jgi:hypothetical protein